METEILDRPWEQLHDLLAAQRIDEIDLMIAEARPGELVRGFLNLSADERAELIALLSPETAARIIEELPPEPAVGLVEGLKATAAAAIVSELSSDQQADVLKELSGEKAEAVLAEMAPRDAKDARELATYPADTAGGLMMTEVFKFESSASVRDILVQITSNDSDYDHFRNHHPYVVDGTGALVGVISLRKLLLSRKATPLPEIMSSATAVNAGTPLDMLEDYFEANAFLSAPVVDDNNHLLGIVLRDTVLNAMRDRADADSRKRQGVIEDELRSMPIFLRAKRRLSWLSINIVLNIVAASVIALNQDTLSAVIALAVFLPIVSDMSGCSGNQAVAVSMRELSLGVVKPIDLFSVLWKEAAVGVLNGLALGMLIALVAWGWKGNPFLGLVVGAALALNTVIAVSIGGSVPLILKHYGVDPAVASGPILTTVTDMVGFFLVLTFAAIAMPVLI